jgi:hypothetical protein
MEGFAAEGRTLSFGHSALDSHLPQGGLACGALHEVAPAVAGDMPAAFGFIAALLGRIPRGGPLLFVMSARGLAGYGRPHGHGLNGLGLDPARVILVETADERQTLGPSRKPCARPRLPLSRERSKLSISRQAKGCISSPAIPAFLSCCCGQPARWKRARRRRGGGSVRLQPRVIASVLSRAGGGI